MFDTKVHLRSLSGVFGLRSLRDVLFCSIEPELPIIAASVVICPVTESQCNAARSPGCPLREIEEVTSTFPVELVGDRRSLVLGHTFCFPDAMEAVAHEIQRLIIEVAETHPDARASWRPGLDDRGLTERA